MTNRLHIEPRLHRPAVVEIHVQGCDCPTCEPYVPSVTPALTMADLGRLALAGVAVAHVIAFTIDPHGSWTALADLVASFVR